MPLTAGALAEQDSKILTVYNKWGRTYRLVTGFVEADEEPGQAALRELQEETGYRAEIDQLLGIYQVGRKVSHLLVVYAVKNLQPHGSLMNRARFHGQLNGQLRLGAENWRWMELADLLKQEKDPGFLKIYQDYEKILSSRKSQKIS